MLPEHWPPPLIVVSLSALLGLLVPSHLRLLGACPEQGIASGWCLRPSQEMPGYDEEAGKASLWRSGCQGGGVPGIGKCSKHSEKPKRIPDVPCPGPNLNLGGWETYISLALIKEEGILLAQGLHRGSEPGSETSDGQGGL